MKDIYQKFKIYGFRRFASYFFTEIYRNFCMEFLRRSYSQKGEDLVLDRFSGHKKKGFYVDVGANDPHRFSNTKRFYLRGWTGINIEPNSANYQKFVKERKRDINLNIGIGNTNAKLTFYQFVPDTLSTFSKKEVNAYVKQGYKLGNIIIVPVRKLANVLSENCKSIIDFLNVDTEGFDMQVLKSNDWDKFKPKLICIEAVSHTMSGTDNKKRDNHEAFLTNLGYKKVFNNGLNSIYKWKH